MSPFEDFLADIVDLAASVDQRLARILSDGAAPEGAPRLPWTGGRLQGLELCLNMLRYAREEAGSGELGSRLEEAIAHVVSELERMRRPQRPLH